MSRQDKQVVAGLVLVALGLVLGVANLVVSMRMDVAYTGLAFAAVVSEALGWGLVLIREDEP